jgi:H+-transporting ATPase
MCVRGIAGKRWTMTGLIPMFDPPRDDTEETIRRAENLGVEVKMITGDHLTIAKETARILGMGTSIFPAEYMKDAEKAKQETGLDLHQIIRQAHGFAQVPTLLVPL